MQKARIVSLQNPEIRFEISSKEILIGRSQDCDICIPEQHISRHQSRISIENNCYVIENLGKNPIFINGTLVEKHFLRDGDHISFGSTEYIFHVEESKPGFQEPIFEEKTVIVSTPIVKESIPRVVLICPDGQSKKYDMNKDTFLIGRTPEAEIHLDDPAISRRHCVITKDREGYCIENLSEANPLIFKNKPVKKRRLISGDQIKMGAYVVSFISDRPEDNLRETENGYTMSKRIHLTIWVSSACLFIVLISSIVYFQIYGPWKARKTLKMVTVYTKEGDYHKAHETLTMLLNRNLPQKESQKARELLSQSTLLIAKEMVSGEKLSDARDFLVTYLSKYGLDKESVEAWDTLDQCHLKLGKQLEDTGNYTEALKEFSAIREEGAYFHEAQQDISRLWLINQQYHFKQQTVSQLMKEAEEHFQAQRYLTPVNKNAYAAYQAVLSLEPSNNIAKKQIEKIKDIYRMSGEKDFQQNDYANAISAFELYMLIDPQDNTIKEKVIECRQKLTLTGKPENDEDARKEKIKRLLEKAGSESTWIMKYLFEEDQQKHTEVP
ncbi:MAG: FHA domain-containing protein [Planctomycetia bacterium]|nr:FHA domain-containing protein [Planctomycetia bacterium]